MVSQAKGGCKECGSMQHTAMYHKPRKPLTRIPIKNRGVISLIDKSRISNQSITEFQNLPVKKKTKKKRTETRGQLVKKLDSVFSQYIRLKESVDVAGERSAVCVTCGDVKPWKQQQCGHFYSRGKYPTRWDEDNCHVQDYRCNVIFSGNYIKYTTWMIDKYGRDFVDELEVKANSGVKITTPEIREKIDYYKKKVEELL